MLQSPTLARLLKNVRNMLNQPNPSNSFWSDDELVEYLNEAVRLYFAEVTQDNEGQFTAVVDLNTTSGVDTVTLPVDFFEVRTLYRKTGDVYVPLAYNNRVDVGFSNVASVGELSYFPYYYFRNNQIVLRPGPLATETAALRLEYIQFPDTLVNGGDRLTASVSPVFKQVIEMYAVYKAKVKESLVNGVNLSGVAKEHLDAVYSNFKESIRSRSKYPQYTNPFNPEGDI